MATALYFISCTLLMIIVFEDFRERMIHWVWLPLLAIALLFYSSSKLGVGWQDWVLNFLFLLLVGSLSVSYLTLVKNVRFQEMLSTYLGIGDVVFFTVMVFVFPVAIFLLYFIVSLLISLIFGIVFLKGKTIPLAGIQSFIMFLIISAFEWDIISVETIENILVL